LLCLQSLYGSLSNNRHHETVKLGIVAPVSSSFSEAGLHSEGIQFGYCLRHLVDTLRFYVVFLCIFIPVLDNAFKWAKTTSTPEFLPLSAAKCYGRKLPYVTPAHVLYFPCPSSGAIIERSVFTESYKNCLCMFYVCSSNRVSLIFARAMNFSHNFITQEACLPIMNSKVLIS
jgi:hypothetical protein